MPYSRKNPSARYLELCAMYHNMHNEGYNRNHNGNEHFIKPEEAFPGHELPKFVVPIKKLIDGHNAKTILDYGAGKGLQYNKIRIQGENNHEFDSIQSFWDVDKITCYDPAVETHNILPEEPSDGVVSTDVLEHCPHEDLPWIIREIFAHANKFVFANIACYPALARLPNGENAHISTFPPQWWNGLFYAIASEFESQEKMVDYVICCIIPTTNANGTRELQKVWLAHPRHNIFINDTQKSSETNKNKENS